MAGTPSAFQANAFQNSAFQTGEPAVVDAPGRTGGGGGRKARSRRRRILLPDGRILIPATDADYRHAVAWIAALQPEQRHLPPAHPRKAKTTRKAPRALQATPLPETFFRQLAKHTETVLYWQTVAKAWQDHQADEEEAIELLLLS